MRKKLLKFKNSICIVIVNYKTYTDLSKCLKALDKQIYMEKYNIKTVLVDCAYDSKEVNKLKKKYPQLIIMLQKDSLGLSTNLNNGFKKAMHLGADYIFMVTPDVFIKKTVLHTFLTRMQENPNLGAVTCKMLLPGKPTRIYFIAGELDKVAYSAGHVGYEEVDKGQYDTFKKTDFLNCALVLFKSEVLKTVGYWDQNFYLAYDDVDWSFRIKKFGYEIEVMKNVFAIHDESQTIGKKSLSKEYYSARNHLLFVKKNARIGKKLLAYSFILKDSIKVFFNLFNVNKRTNAKYILLGRYDFLTNNFLRKV